MSVSVVAFIEYHKQEVWWLFDAIDYSDFEPSFNFAPDSWGKYNFNVYSEYSQEKGLPADISLGLQKTIAKYFNHEINRPSWMTLDEMIAFQKEDSQNQYAHLNVEHLLTLHQGLKTKIRVVFWAV